MYIIPKFIYGVPLFNLAECIKYLYEKLTENGFKVYYTHPNLLVISWLHLKEKKQLKINTTKRNDYTPIDNYRPSGNLIYNNSNLNILDSKTSSLFN